MHTNLKKSLSWSGSRKTELRIGGLENADNSGDTDTAAIAWTHTGSMPGPELWGPQHQPGKLDRISWDVTAGGAPWRGEHLKQGSLCPGSESDRWQVCQRQRKATTMYEQLRVPRAGHLPMYKLEFEAVLWCLLPLEEEHSMVFLFALLL